jgi:hypothetical protein
MTSLNTLLTVFCALPLVVTLAWINAEVVESTENSLLPFRKIDNPLTVELGSMLIEMTECGRSVRRIQTKDRDNYQLENVASVIKVSERFVRNPRHMVIAG